MFDFSQDIVVPNKEETHQYAEGWKKDEEETARRIKNPNLTLKSAFVHIEVMDLPREVKAISLMEIALSLIQIITLGNK